MKTYIVYGQVAEAGGREMALSLTQDASFAYIEAETIQGSYPGARVAETEDEALVAAARAEIAEVTRLEEEADAEDRREGATHLTCLALSDLVD